MKTKRIKNFEKFVNESLYQPVDDEILNDEINGDVIEKLNNLLTSWKLPLNYELDIKEAFDKNKKMSIEKFKKFLNAIDTVGHERKTLIMKLLNSFSGPNPYYKNGEYKEYYDSWISEWYDILNTYNEDV